MGYFNKPSANMTMDEKIVQLSFSRLLKNRLDESPRNFPRTILLSRRTSVMKPLPNPEASVASDHTCSISSEPRLHFPCMLGVDRQAHGA